MCCHDLLNRRIHLVEKEEDEVIFPMASIRKIGSSEFFSMYPKTDFRFSSALKHCAHTSEEKTFPESGVKQ